MKINLKMSSANGGHFVFGRWFNAWIRILQSSPSQFKENVMNSNNPLKNAEGGSVDKAKQKWSSSVGQTILHMCLFGLAIVDGAKYGKCK